MTLYSSLACRCAAEARRQNLQWFALQYYGECWARDGSLQELLPRYVCLSSPIKELKKPYSWTSNITAKARIHESKINVFKMVFRNERMAGVA